MKTAPVLFQTIAATGLLGVFGIINPARVSSQQLMSEIGKAPFRISKILESSQTPLRCTLPNRTDR